MTETQTATLKADRKKDCKAKSIIYQGLDEATFELITSPKSSKEVWDTLHKTYKCADKVKRIRLQILRDMKINILSLRQLLEKGYHISLQNMQLTITDARGKLVTRVQMTKNMMFPLAIHHDTPRCLTAIIDNKDWLWHLRLLFLRPSAALPALLLQ
ncbi:hypothetical protein LWI28_000297 [Acer negundo]|uniref:Uncharacterized protein n=1 Tax=Acer negundo TaxID=4023 RepID=A0AAD5INJ1_ACENE|nr:hypothetical protein LWI28_000297 [Acer negundo]